MRSGASAGARPAGAHHDRPPDLLQTSRLLHVSQPTISSGAAALWLALLRHTAQELSRMDGSQQPKG